MESNEASGLIGKKVWWDKGKQIVIISDYEKGWVTITINIDLPEGEKDNVEQKVRAKELMLLDSNNELDNSGDELKEVETKIGVTEVDKEGKELDPEKGLTEEDPSTSSSGPDSGIQEGQSNPGPEVPPEGGNPGPITCGCGHVFTPAKNESVKCPECGAWYKVRLHPNLDHYVKGMAATASGRDTVDIDDTVATMLRGLTLEDLYLTVCEELGKINERARYPKAMQSAMKNTGMECKEFLEEKYGSLNPGMQRMNLGNLLRGAYKRHETFNLIEEAKSKKVTNGK